MFGNIPEFTVVTVISAVAVIAWLTIVQWSRYQAHIKANVDSSEEKRAAAEKYNLLSYYIIPLIFGALAVVGGLFCADYLAAHHVIVGAEEIGGLAVALSVIVYAVLDKYIVKNCGDAVYFETVEDAVVKSAGESAESSQALNASDVAALKKLAEAFKKN